MKTLDILMQRLNETREHRDGRATWINAAEAALIPARQELAEDEAEMADLSRAIDLLTDQGFDVTVFA